MQELIYSIHFLGSFSLGYFLLRLGLPSSQEYSLQKKLIFGLLLGTLLFIPGLVAAIQFDENYFYILPIILFTLSSTLLLIKRKILKEEDYVKLVEKKKIKVILPNKVLTKEEINKENNEEDNINEQKDNIQLVDEKNIKEQLFKEKNTNLVGDLRKIIKDSKKDNAEKEKLEALEKLRNSAKQIKSSEKLFEKKQEKKVKEEDDLEEMFEFE